MDVLQLFCSTVNRIQRTTCAGTVCTVYCTIILARIPSFFWITQSCRTRTELRFYRRQYFDADASALRSYS
jgi:hypothetical protein